ncbi:MAG: hypothetical protein B7X48_14995 [Acidiphilium sp. 34-60-192]|nr:MAG: hypothetical protein B7X48_14995 [Acidiphilium sp. 34-60-192]
MPLLANFPSGCRVAEIEIDPQTGVTTLVRYTAVDDAGLVLNPVVAEGQIHGRIAQGSRWRRRPMRLLMRWRRRGGSIDYVDSEAHGCCGMVAYWFWCCII